MGNTQSSDDEEEEVRPSSGVSTVLLKLKAARDKGELSEEEYQREMKAAIAASSTKTPPASIPNGKPHPTNTGNGTAGGGGEGQQQPPHGPPSVSGSGAQGSKEAGGEAGAGAGAVQQQQQQPAVAVDPVQSTNGMGREHRSPVKERSVDVGEGSLAVKMLRLKAKLNSREISKAQYDYTMRKLLRVKAFGCDCGADLERGITKGEGWMCNVCEMDLPAETVVFSCADCNWDGCKACLDEAKTASSSEQQQVLSAPHTSGDGPAVRAPGHDEPKVLSAVERFRCPGGHLLKQGRTESRSWSCNVCARELPAKSAIYSCRECDWDGCGLCFARAADELPKDAVQRTKAPPQKDASGGEKATEVCPDGHELIEYSTPDDQWACDRCRSVARVGWTMFGCRLCNYDLCALCYDGTKGGGGDEPGGGRAAGRKANGASTIAGEVLRLKGARNAGWLSEDEYNYELKKIFAAKVAPEGGDGISGFGQDGDSFGCPMRHLLKQFSTPEDSKWSCNVCKQELPAGTVVFGCRACDWDGCSTCLDKSREEGAELKKGSQCWYRRPDKTLCPSEVLSVDYALQPPSYLVNVDGNARETERARLLAFLPSDGKAAITGNPPPSSSSSTTASSVPVSRPDANTVKVDPDKKEAAAAAAPAPAPAATNAAAADKSPSKVQPPVANLVMPKPKDGAGCESPSAGGGATDVHEEEEEVVVEEEEEEEERELGEGVLG